MSRAPLPEVRNSHLAGVLERKRAREVLSKIERRRAQKERKRARKLARREAQMQATQQTFAVHQPTAEPTQKKKRHITPNHLPADVRRRLVDMARTSDGKERLVALYNAHAPSKAGTHAARAAVSTIVRFSKRQALHPMSREQFAIWMAIDRNVNPPSAEPLPVPESAPEPLRAPAVEPESTSLQQTAAIPADPIAIALQQIAEQGRQTTQLVTYLLTKQQGYVQQSARPALGFSPPRVQVPEMGRRGQIRWLIESYLLRTNENTQEGFRKAYRRLYLEFQDCTGVRIQKTDDPETKLGWIEEHGHIEALYAVAYRVFGEH